MAYSLITGCCIATHLTERYIAMQVTHSLFPRAQELSSFCSVASISHRGDFGTVVHLCLIYIIIQLHLIRPNTLFNMLVVQGYQGYTYIC